MTKPRKKVDYQLYHVNRLISIPGPIHPVELAEDGSATVLIHRRLRFDGSLGTAIQWVITDAKSGGSVSSIGFKSVKTAKDWLNTKRDFILEKFQSGVREAFIEKHHKEKPRCLTV